MWLASSFDVKSYGVSPFFVRDSGSAPCCTKSCATPRCPDFAAKCCPSRAEHSGEDEEDREGLERQRQIQATLARLREGPEGGMLPQRKPKDFERALDKAFNETNETEVDLATVAHSIARPSE